MFSLGILHSVREMQKALLFLFFFFLTKGVWDERGKLQIQQIQLLRPENNLFLFPSSHHHQFLF